MGELQKHFCLDRLSLRATFGYRQTEYVETLMATGRHKKEMKIGIPDSARSCAGVQLNAPTYRMDDRRMANADTGLVTDKR
jgi:hypothetical protein